MSCWAPFQFLTTKRSRVPLLEKHVSEFQHSFYSEIAYSDIDESNDRVRKWLNCGQADKQTPLKVLKDYAFKSIKLFSQRNNDESCHDISGLYWIQRAASCQSGFSDFNWLIAADLIFIFYRVCHKTLLACIWRESNGMDLSADARNHFQIDLHLLQNLH